MKVCTEDNCNNPQFGGKKCVTHQWKRTDKVLKELKRSPLKRKQSVLKRTRINPVSKKQSKRLAKYRTQRLEFLKENPQCGKCGEKATEIHHKKGRGVHTNDVESFMSICRTCHEWVHLNPKYAKALGYLE
jgi:hypothetical protein